MGLVRDEQVRGQEDGEELAPEQHKHEVNCVYAEHISKCNETFTRQYNLPTHAAAHPEACASDASGAEGLR